MHPYRTVPPAPAPPPPPTEELPIYGLMVVCGAVPIVTAIAQDRPFGITATIGMVAVLLGAGGLLRWLARRRKR